MLKINKKIKIHIKRIKAKKSNTEIFGFSSYKITYDALSIPGVQSLSRQDDELFIKSYSFLLQHKPLKASLILEDLLKIYPSHPQIQNNLAEAYAMSMQDKKSIAMTIKNYKDNPNYPFSKFNYAYLCLQNGESDKIPEIFNHKFDLSLIFTNRKEFHVSEVIGFCGIMSLYFAKINNKKQSEVYINLIEKLNPDHPNLFKIKEIIANLEEKECNTKSLQETHLSLSNKIPIIAKAMKILKKRLGY